MSTTTASDADRRPPSDPPSGASQFAALVGFVAAAQLAGLVGLPFTVRTTGGWYDSLDTPVFNPPTWVFGPVWTVLYLMIGVAAWLVWRRTQARGRVDALTWWAVQLVLNAAWTPLFFGARMLWLAFAEILVLWAAIVATTAAFRGVDRRAALLMVPYLLWVTFAAVLNGTIAVMN